MVQNNIQGSLSRLRSSSSPIIQLQPPAALDVDQRAGTSSQRADQYRLLEDFAHFLQPASTTQERSWSIEPNSELKFLLVEQPPTSQLEQPGFSQSESSFSASDQSQLGGQRGDERELSKFLQLQDELRLRQGHPQPGHDSYTFTDVLNLKPVGQEPRLPNSNQHLEGRDHAPAHMMLDSLMMTGSLKPELRMAGLVAQASMEESAMPADTRVGSRQWVSSTPAPSLESLYSLLEQQLTLHRDVGLISPPSAADTLSLRSDSQPQPSGLGILSGDGAALAAYHQLHQQALSDAAAQTAYQQLHQQALSGTAAQTAYQQLHQQQHSDIAQAAYQQLPNIPALLPENHQSQVISPSPGPYYSPLELRSSQTSLGTGISYGEQQSLGTVHSFQSYMSPSGPSNLSQQPPGLWQERRGKTTLHEDTSFQPSIPDVGTGRPPPAVLPFLGSQLPEILPFFTSNTLQALGGPTNSPSPSTGGQNSVIQSQLSGQYQQSSYRGQTGVAGGSSVGQLPPGQLMGGDVRQQLEPMYPLGKADPPPSVVMGSNTGDAIRRNNSFAAASIPGIAQQNPCS